MYAVIFLMSPNWRQIMMRDDVRLSAWTLWSRPWAITILLLWRGCSHSVFRRVSSAVWDAVWRRGDILSS